MVDLSLRERLQPSLPDRLVDEDRLLIRYDVRVFLPTLHRMGLSETDVVDILHAQGLERDHRPSAGGDKVLHLRFFSSYGRVSLSRLKTLMLRPAARARGVPLQTLCSIHAQTVTNDTPESGDQRFASMGRLREYVCRDLVSLLNSASLDEALDLSHHPEVQRSVLNYGMPSLAGRAAMGIDVEGTARTIEEAIRRFEPRLTSVRVTPDPQEGVDEHRHSFRIEAVLWSQPSSQHLVLHTQIDSESGDVFVRDTGIGR